MAERKRFSWHNFNLRAKGALGERPHILLDTILLGIIGALGAQLFMLMLRVANTLFLNIVAGYQSPGLASEGGPVQQVIGPHGLWLIPVVTMLGGLISGILVYGLAPEAEGHGTDTAVKAFHRKGGVIRTRVSPLKMIASAITIGSGGAAGREGPAALITAGIGSIYARFAKRSVGERRLLVLIGMAAGLSAIFRSPIGTALFAIEVLYGGMEFEAGALLYTMLASVVAYAVNGLFVGYQPLFHVPADLGITSFTDYVWYIILGVIAGLIATLLPTVFYGLRDAFHAIHIPPHFKPALGGLAVGLMALWLPQVLGGGYGWIQEAIDGRLALNLMLVLVFAKMIAFALTVSSGGSGGVFAPSLFVGAMVGGFLAKVFDQPSAAFVVVGMAAVFGGAARIPIATLLMVTEMTGGYQLLVPAALAVMLSYLIQATLTSGAKYKSLYEAQVQSGADSPAHRADYLSVALRLLEDRHVTFPANLNAVDLRSLLAADVPIDLPGPKKLLTGVLSKDSSCVGHTLHECFPSARKQEVEAVAVFRRENTLLPDPDLQLHAKDRLLIIAAPKYEEQIEQHFNGHNHQTNHNGQ
jgi:CIC family chloride channel protein